MSQDKPVLSREQIEMLRAGILDSEWCGYSKRKTVNALCDLALSALDRPASGSPTEEAWVATHADGSVLHFAVKDGWTVVPVLQLDQGEKDGKDSMESRGSNSSS